MQVVKEYLRIIEDGLKQAYQEHGDSKEISNLFLKPFNVSEQTQKYYNDMPKFLGYKSTELTEREKLEIEYEKDVFQMKLSVNEEALVDKIIEKLNKSRGTSNPLINDDTFFTNRKPSHKDSFAIGYVLADSALKDKSSAAMRDTSYARAIKKEGLKILQRDQDPLYIEQ